MGRPIQDIAKCKEARDAAGYRREFGDKQLFERGYSEGLRVGYADGFTGRNFRALGELQAAAELMPHEAEVRPDPAFDQAFSLGYSSGQQQGIKDGRHVATFTHPEVACPAPQPQSQHSFCAGYVGGYRVGYSDGFINVARPVMAQAEARGGGK
jgi:flagellar biosynthesis/type III secretory pathway protein FliH